MKINIMAASGQLGQKTIQALFDQGLAPSNLIASVRTPEKAAALFPAAVEIRKADYQDADSMEAAFQDTDVLFLIPSTAAVEPRILEFNNAVNAAKATGVKRVVYASVASAAFPHSKFLVSPFLIYAEMRLRQSGLDWTILRNNMYLDPVCDWIPDLIKMGRLPYPVKQGRIAYITRDDLGCAAAAALLNSGHENKIYNLTGPYAVTMDELAAKISQVAGKTITFHEASYQEYADTCVEDGKALPDFFIRILYSIYEAVDNGEYELVTDHVERLTGKPAESILDYMSRRWQEDNK